MSRMTPARAAELSKKIQSVTVEVTAENIGRGDEVLVTFLALIAGKPTFLLGPPGVTKTGTVRATANRIEGARYYRALMPGVTSPDALFYKGQVIRETMNGDDKEISVHGVLGRAAAAEIFFADEAFKTPDAVLNPLLDFANGDGVEYEGEMMKVPLRAFIAASNELPDPGSNLAALWSRMTIRVFVNPLSWDKKMQMVDATHRGARKPATAKVTLAEMDELRDARKTVLIPQAIKDTVRRICEVDLCGAKPDEFRWLAEDDRRFKRLFDVLQAAAILDGRLEVAKKDLVVLRWLLWDTPEQIPTVEAVLKPYIRTPLSEARQLIDELLEAGGFLHAWAHGDNGKTTKALAAIDEACKSMAQLAQGLASSEATTVCTWAQTLEDLKPKFATWAVAPKSRESWEKITALFTEVK